ncbi:MAG: ABC transporter substrate-binding protein [Anaerolineales bacterium]|nr:ABC transporter substrate-binding protein [Anaerolineales bacterium]
MKFLKSNTGGLALILSLMVCLSLLLASCAAPATPEPTPVPTTVPTPTPITLTDGLGRAISLTSPAQRIVSLAPSNTEILFAVGAGAQTVGRDDFSSYPEAALALPDVGGGMSALNLELIVSLKPDLVLVADITAAEQIKAIEDLGLVVYALPNPKSFDELFQNLETVGLLTGNSTQALVEGLQERVKAVEEKIATASERPLVFYELDSTDPNAPWTPGPGTFIETLITMSGGQNLGSSLESEWAQISLENLLTLDPEMIILGDFTWGGVTPEAVYARSGWDALSAVKNNKVFTFDDNLVSRPGPRLVDGLEAMARLLHPELFQ